MYGGSCQLTVSDRTSEYNKASPTATYGAVHIRKTQNRETQKIVEYQTAAKVSYSNFKTIVTF